MFFDFGNLNPPEPRFFWKYGMYPQSHGLASCSLLQLVLWGYIPFPGIPIPHSSLVKSMCLILKSLKSIKLLEESPKGHQHPFHRKPPQSIWFRGLGFPTNFPNQPSPNPPSHVSLPPHPAPPHCGASAAAAAPAPARRAPAASASSAPSRHASVAAAGAAAAWSKGPSPRGDTEHWLGFGEKNMEKIRLLYDELRSMIFNNGHIIYCNRHIFCLVGIRKIGIEPSNIWIEPFSEGYCMGTQWESTGVWPTRMIFDVGVHFCFRKHMDLHDLLAISMVVFLGNFVHETTSNG